jgi:hypothetical protein
MLTIRCTKKLLDELKLKPYENPEENHFSIAFFERMMLFTQLRL